MKQIKINILPGTIGKYNEYLKHIFDADVEYKQLVFDARDGNVFCVSPTTLNEVALRVYNDTLANGSLYDISPWCIDWFKGTTSMKDIRFYLTNQFCTDHNIYWKQYIA